MEGVVRVLVVVVLGRQTKGKSGLCERGSCEVVVQSIVEDVLHARILPGHSLGEVKGEVIFAAAIKHQIGAKVCGKGCGTLAPRGPTVKRGLDDDGVLVGKVVISREKNPIQRVVQEGGLQCLCSIAK